MGLRVDAVELYGRVCGANRSRIMKCSDGHYYVVKKPNGAHPKRSLANELLASLILKRIGISTPEPAIVNCSTEFLERFAVEPPKPRPIEFSENLVDAGTFDDTWQSGLSFGSRIEYGGWRNPEYCPQSQYLPDHLLARVTNLREFIDIAAFDAWCCIRDSRQAIFVRPNYGEGYKAFFLDHGLCFGGRDWKLDVTTRYAIYDQHLVYDSVYGIDAFFDIVHRIHDRCTLSALREDAAQIPKEWYDHDEASLGRLLRVLSEDRRFLLFRLDLLSKLKPSPFKNWSSNWKDHPQNAFLRDSFFKIKVPALPPRKKRSVA